MDTLSNILNIHVKNINWPYINQNPYFNDNVTIYKSLFKNNKHKIISNKLSTINSKNIKNKNNNNTNTDTDTDTDTNTYIDIDTEINTITNTNTTKQLLSKDDKKFFFTLKTSLFNNLSFYKTDHYNSFYHSIWVCLSPNFNYFVNSAEHYHFKDYIYLYFSEKNIFNNCIKGNYKVTKKTLLNKLKTEEYCIYKLLILSKIFKINIIIYQNNELSCHNFDSNLPSIIIYINNNKQCFPLINPQKYNTWAWDSQFISNLTINNIEFQGKPKNYTLKELQTIANQNNIDIKHISKKTNKLIFKKKEELLIDILPILNKI